MNNVFQDHTDTYSKFASVYNAAEAQKSGNALHVRPALAPAATILETNRIKVTWDKEGKRSSNFYEGISIKCKSWLCKTCRISKGIKLREKVLSRSHLFKVPKLYTITVNREWFKSPQEAYQYLMEKKFISRLLTKEMGIRRWFWVLEAQEASGDGWPHWHLLIDVGDCSGTWYHAETKTSQENKPDNRNGWVYVPHFFDLNKVHRLLEKWKIGKQCKLTVRKDKFNNPVHAIRYITKYLIKVLKRGFPPWMLEYSGLRFYQPSKEIGTFGEKKDVKKIKNDKCQKKRSRRPIDRIAECGKRMIFMGYDQALDKHEITRMIYAFPESMQYIKGAVCYTVHDMV